MQKTKSKFYLIIILLANILVYLLKIDKDVFAFQEYFSQPNQTYTAQPFSKTVSYFDGFILSFHQSHATCDVKNIYIKKIAIWNSVNFLYNSRVHYLLKHYETHIILIPAIRIVCILHRKNISHKSSEDEVLRYHFLA